MARTETTGQVPFAAAEPRNHMHIRALDGARAASILLVLLTHTAPLGPKF